MEKSLECVFNYAIKQHDVAACCLHIHGIKYQNVCDGHSAGAV